MWWRFCKFEENKLDSMERLSDYIIKSEEAINKIKIELKNNLASEESYLIKSYVKWGASTSRIEFDIVVEKSNNIIAIFEIKQSSKGVEIAKNRMLNYVFQNTSALFFVIFNASENKYLLFERNSGCKNNIDLSEIISIIKNQLEKNVLEEESKNKLRFYQTSEKILDPEYCREQLGKLSVDRICRYSSLESLFATLKYKTLRMNSLPGMNDKSEGLFAWELLYKSEKFSNDAFRKRLREINNAYIVSFSHEDKLDDLTQWRLYGDDAKGVCCVYSVITEKVKDRFFIHDIKYIRQNPAYEIIDDTYLELLRTYIKEQDRLTYLDLSPTIFFYKLDIFASEKEIRLLVDNKMTSAYNKGPYQREWLLTNSNKIPNPYIDVPLNEIPIKLEKILLGPNMNDVNTIQAQLEAMLEQQGIDAKVELSEICEYRNQTC